jgi:hypothetical protein
MANEERSDIKVENGIATWELRSDGLLNGTYFGTFQFKCYLDPISMIKANREYRDLIGPNYISAPEHETFLAYALTQLKYRVIKGPPFWSSTLDVSGFAGNIPDENIISEVLNAALDSELKHRSQLKERKDTALDKAKKAAEAMLAEQRAELTDTKEESNDEG